MTKSKFSLWVVLTFFVILILSGVNYLIFSKLFVGESGNISFGILIFIGLLVFT